MPAERARRLSLSRNSLPATPLLKHEVLDDCDLWATSGRRSGAAATSVAATYVGWPQLSHGAITEVVVPWGQWGCYRWGLAPFVVRHGGSATVGASPCRSQPGGRPPGTPRAYDNWGQPPADQPPADQPPADHPPPAGPPVAAETRSLESIEVCAHDRDRGGGHAGNALRLAQGLRTGFRESLDHLA
jgi:hypothetical protein